MWWQPDVFRRRMFSGVTLSNGRDNSMLADTCGPTTTSIRVLPTTAGRRISDAVTARRGRATRSLRTKKREEALTLRATMGAQSRHPSLRRPIQPRPHAAELIRTRQSRRSKPLGATASPYHAGRRASEQGAQGASEHWVANRPRNTGKWQAGSTWRRVMPSPARPAKLPAAESGAWEWLDKATSCLEDHRDAMLLHYAYTERSQASEAPPAAAEMASLAPASANFSFDEGAGLHYACQGLRCRHCGSYRNTEAWPIMAKPCPACFGQDCGNQICPCWGRS